MITMFYRTREIPFSQVAQLYSFAMRRQTVLNIKRSKQMACFQFPCRQSLCLIKCKYWLKIMCQTASFFPFRQTARCLPSLLLYIQTVSTVSVMEIHSSGTLYRLSERNTRHCIIDRSRYDSGHASLYPIWTQQ